MSEHQSFADVITTRYQRGDQDMSLRVWNAGGVLAITVAIPGEKWEHEFFLVEDKLVPFGMTLVQEKVGGSDALHLPR